MQTTDEAVGSGSEPTRGLIRASDAGTHLIPIPLPGLPAAARPAAE